MKILFGLHFRSLQVRIIYSTILVCCLPGCQPERVVEVSKVVVGLDAEPDQLNLLLARTSYAAQVADHIFMSMLAFDPASLELEPALALHLPERSRRADEMTLAFEIRPEAVWDDGSPVLARDVLFTIKTILCPEIPVPYYRSYLSLLKDVQIDPANERRVLFKFKRPYILADAAVGLLPVYSARHYDSLDLLGNISVPQLLDTHLADSLAAEEPGLQRFARHFSDARYSQDGAFIQAAGPYRLAEWQRGQRIRLVKKAHWWGAALASKSSLFVANPDEIHYRFLADDATAVSLLQSGEIDVLGNIEPSIFNKLRADERLKKDYHFYDPLFLSYYYIGMYRRSPKLADKRVRRALAHLLNVERYIAQFMYGLAERTHGPIHPSKAYYHTHLEPLAYNPLHAKYLLEQAGWRDSDGNGILDRRIEGKQEELRLSYKLPRANEIGLQVGVLLQQAARSAGIEIRLEALEFNKLIEDYKKRDYELIFLRLGKLPALDDLRPSWHTSGDTPAGGNRVGFGSVASDALIDSILVNFDAAKRREQYFRIQEMIYEEQACIFLFCPRERIAIHRRFKAQASVLRPGYFPAQFEIGKSKDFHDKKIRNE